MREPVTSLRSLPVLSILLLTIADLIRDKLLSLHRVFFPLHTSKYNLYQYVTCIFSPILLPPVDTTEIVAGIARGEYCFSGKAASRWNDVIRSLETIEPNMANHVREEPQVLWVVVCLVRVRETDCRVIVKSWSFVQV